MPRVLLINPQFNVPRASYERSLAMGIFYLATYLDKMSISVKIIDGARQQNYIELIKKELPNTDFAGISSMTTQLPSALNISKLIKEYNKSIKIIWGGVHPTLFPEATASHPLIDAVVIGEGEKTLYEIIKNDFKNIEQVQVIAFKKEEKIIKTQERPLINMNELPEPNWKLMPEEIIEKLQQIPIHTSRGCPHRCSFCVNAILKNRWRAKNPDQVIREIKNTLSGPGAGKKTLVFWEENFFVDKSRSENILKKLIEEKINISRSTTCRADYFRDDFINDEFLDLIKKSGCELLSMGAESGSLGMLKKIQKDLTPEDLIYSAQQCVKHGISPIYSFMVGLPGETWKDTKKTLRLIDRLTEIDRRVVKIIGPQTFRPYPGSPLFEECISMGWDPPSSLEEWSGAMSGELNYLNSHKLPWLKNPDVVESLDVMVRLGANPIKYAFGLEVKANKILKFLFILLCRIRWKLKFFQFPIEYKLAKKFISKASSDN